MNTTAPGILLRPDPELLAKIDAECGGIGKHGRGYRQGRSAWVIDHLCRHFELPVPTNGATMRDTPIPDLKRMDTSGLEPRKRLIVDLYKGGMRPEDIPAK